jgi:F0F1-type ATP synthase assembly protein I
MAEPGRKGGNPWSAGFELAGAVAGFTLVGMWVDHHYHSDPWGVLVGVALGLVGGTYNLIRDSIAASRDSDNRTDPNGRKR